MRRLLACLLLAASLPAMAEIFSYTDANGNTVFTNDPPPDSNAQSVNLPPVNGMTATPNSSPSTPPENTPSTAEQPTSSDPSTQPTRQTTINDNDNYDDEPNYEHHDVEQPRREVIDESRREHVEAHRR